MIKTFVKKIAKVQAVQWTRHNFKEIADFIGIENLNVIWQEDGFPSIGITIMEGLAHVSLGDWIILGVLKEPYPCKPDIFEKIYDPL